MYNQKSHHLYFIGIGGVGMAGIAEVLWNLGYKVSGSDLKRSALTEHLERLGIKIAYGHRAENVPADTTVAVVSSAVREDNTELLAVREIGVPVVPRAEMLAELMRMKYGVAVAGAHGKTTTTTMIAKILGDSGLDPTVIIGGRVLSRPSGARLGSGSYLVAEADESDGSFLYLRPAIAVVTNIDSEHLSHYGSLSELEEAFKQFIRSVPFYGLVVACGDDPVVTRICQDLRRRVVTYGLSPGLDYRATNIRQVGGESVYDLEFGGQNRGTVAIPMPGTHMVINSLAALAVGLELGSTLEQVTAALKSFPGVARRSEVLAKHNGVVVIDDYAHHPTEIVATLNGLRRGYLQGADSPGRLIVLFQPHRYSRTKELFHEFLTAFGEADELIVGDIYAAGEEEIPGVSAEQLSQAIQHDKVSYVRDLNDALPGLIKVAKAGDVIVTMGAGSVTNTGHKLAELLVGE